MEITPELIDVLNNISDAIFKVSDALFLIFFAMLVNTLSKFRNF